MYVLSQGLYNYAVRTNTGVKGFSKPPPLRTSLNMVIYAIKDGLQKVMFNGRLMQTEFSAMLEIGLIFH